MSTGSWAASLICLIQTSPESPKLFHLLYRLFSSEDLADLEAKALNAVSSEQWREFLQYCACFLGNLGNYLSFGDTKFIPRCPSSSARAIIAASSKADELLGEWDALAEDIYDLSPSKRQMGLDGKGVSTYYSSDITTEEIKAVQVPRRRSLFYLC